MIQLLFLGHMKNGLLCKNQTAFNNFQSFSEVDKLQVISIVMFCLVPFRWLEKLTVQFRQLFIQIVEDLLWPLVID